MFQGADGSVFLCDNILLLFDIFDKMINLNDFSSGRATAAGMQHRHVACMLINCHLEGVREAECRKPGFIFFWGAIPVR